MGIYKKLEIDYDYEIVEEFLSHFSMMLGIMEPLIIDLENEDKFKRNINELFRIFHNIKSASSYLKLEPINKLATLSEEILEECRLVEGSATDELVEWLLSINDQMQLYKKDIDNDSEDFCEVSKKVIKIPTKFVKK